MSYTTPEIITDEWARWQQGHCGTYAVALMRAFPHLRLAAIGYLDYDGWRLAHFAAHDDHYAYDSAGRHPLPYRLIDGSADVCELDQVAGDYGIPEEEAGPEGAEVHLQDAWAHAQRNGIAALVESEAAEFIGALPDAASGRYSLDGPER